MNPSQQRLRQEHLQHSPPPHASPPSLQSLHQQQCPDRCPPPAVHGPGHAHSSQEDHLAEDHVHSYSPQSHSFHQHQPQHSHSHSPSYSHPHTHPPLHPQSSAQFHVMPTSQPTSHPRESPLPRPIHFQHQQPSPAQESHSGSSHHFSRHHQNQQQQQLQHQQHPVQHFQSSPSFHDTQPRRQHPSQDACSPRHFQPQSDQEALPSSTGSFPRHQHSHSLHSSPSHSYEANPRLQHPTQGLPEQGHHHQQQQQQQQQQSQGPPWQYHPKTPSLSLDRSFSDASPERIQQQPESNPFIPISPNSAPGLYTHPAPTQMDRHYVLTSVTPAGQRRLSTSHTSRSMPLQSERSSEREWPLTGLSADGTLSAQPQSAPRSHRTSSHQQGPPPLSFSPPQNTDQVDRINVNTDQKKGQKPSPYRNPPPPIRTKWSDDRMKDCPPLSFPTNSGQSVSSKSAMGKMSPWTPRSTVPHPIMCRSLLDPTQEPEFVKGFHTNRPPPSTPYITESPTDYGHTRPYYEHPVQQDHDDMEHCSEQDDVRDREQGDEEEDDDVDDSEDAMTGPIKKRRTALRPSSPFHSTDDDLAITRGSTLPGMIMSSSSTSNSSSRKPSNASSLQSDEKLVKPSRAKAKTLPRRQSPRPPSQAESLDEAMGLDEDGAVPGTGLPASTRSGLSYYSQRVCHRVQALRVTTYNELVDELAVAPAGEEPKPTTGKGQDNIRRRVYDALNVLEALGIIYMDNKEIRWVGVENSTVIKDAGNRIRPVGPPSHYQEHNRVEDEESEEPEDDEMDIEQLQQEVDAMKLGNGHAKAQIQDQATRYVQLKRLVDRNKSNEAKELERAERRKQRRAQRDQEKREQAAEGQGDETAPRSEERRKKSERRHHRRRSPQVDAQGEVDGETGENMEVNSGDEDELARQMKKLQRQERKERRERKEQRALRRQEKEEQLAAAAMGDERIQLPFVVVRLPGYVGQSSDSESSISVVRRVREDQKARRSGKNKRHCAPTGEETTLVEIQIPQQDELSIISDTEILGDLGFNTVTLDELQAILPRNVMETVQYEQADMRDHSPAHGVVVQTGFERERIRNAAC